MVICLERGADLHMVQLMPLPLTVSCSRKIQIGFTFLVPARLGSPGKRAVKRVCVYIYINKSTYQKLKNLDPTQPSVSGADRCVGLSRGGVPLHEVGGGRRIAVDVVGEVALVRTLFIG